VSFGNESASTRAWRRVESEKLAREQAEVDLARLRAALEHIAADGAVSPATYARHVLGGGKP
jgi:hypothetical protein